MAAEDDLRLAWIAHREGKSARRDALLTLAVASAGMGGADWVDRVRAFLVATRRDHLFSRPGPLDEALSDSRVIAAIVRLRQSFPPDRVTRLVGRDAVARGPFPGRPGTLAAMLDDLLAPARVPRVREVVRLGLAGSRPIPAGALGPLGPATPKSAGLPESTEPVLSFYLTVLLGVAALCAMVLDDRRNDRAA